jgi:CubicO group peptidase (beta-lactamase class C family)
MAFFTRKRIIWTVVLAVLIAAFLYVGITFGPYLKELPIGAGCRAKILCSSVFVSGREPNEVIEEDLSFHPLLDLIRTKVDYENKEVTASLFGMGIFQKKAVYHEDLGGILLQEVKKDEVMSWSVDIPEPFHPYPDNLAWPAGDYIYEDEFPEGVDVNLIEDALDKAFSEPDPEKLYRTRAVVIVYDGKIIGERYAQGYKMDTPLISWSMAKSVTSALVGILIMKKNFDIYAPAPVPEWQGEDDPRSAITTDQLLRMSSGLQFHEEYETSPISDVNLMLFTQDDMARYAAEMPLDAEIDTKYNYSTGTTMILSYIIRETIGFDPEYYAFPRKELFNKINMRSAVFETDASGTFLGGSNIYACARDWARFGLLYLNDGVWYNERILPEGWVEYTLTPTPTSKKQDYGAQFQLNVGSADNPDDRKYKSLPRDLYSLEGYQHQYTVVIPSKKLVVVRLGMTIHGNWNMEEFVSDILNALPE